MPELPRLEKFSPVEVTPFPTARPEAASRVSQATAQGAGELENVFGHTAAKDIELHREEKKIEDRLMAENMAHQQYTSFVTTSDKIRTGEIPDDEGNPYKTDDLMTVYGRLQGEHRKAGLDGLKDAGPLAQYAFANEFDSLSVAHLQRLHTDRDRRKLGDLQGEFDTSFKNIIDYTAHGSYSSKIAEQKYREVLNDVGTKIFSPEQRHARETQDIKAIHLAPYYQQVATGKGPEVFEKIASGKIKDLSGEELLDLRSKVMEDNWKVTSKQAADYTAKKHAFDDNSEQQVISRQGDIRQGAYTRSMLEQDAPKLGKEDYKFLDASLSVQEHAGGPGNGPIHAGDKLNIAMNPTNWTPERIQARIAATGMNPVEGLDLLNEWYKAKQQERNAENDPSHFSKDHRFKMYYGGLERDLGVSPFSVLKPQDQNIVQQAKYDYYNTFQLQYDAHKQLPDFEVEHDRIINRYRSQMSWELEHKVPYASAKEALADWKAGKITKERFIEVGELLLQKERAALLDEKVKK